MKGNMMTETNRAFNYYMMTETNRAFNYYSLVGTLVGHWPDMDEKFAHEIAEVVINAGYTYRNVV